MSNITADEALDMAKFQLPGIVIKVGPEFGSIEKMNPISDLIISKMPGDYSWFLYDLKKELGFKPSCWTLSFVIKAYNSGYKASKQEVEWLSFKANQKEAIEWLKGKVEKQ